MARSNCYTHKTSKARVMRAFFMQSSSVLYCTAEHGSYAIQYACFTRIDVGPERIRLCDDRRTVFCIL